MLTKLAWALLWQRAFPSCRNQAAVNCPGPPAHPQVNPQNTGSHTPGGCRTREGSLVTCPLVAVQSLKLPGGGQRGSHWCPRLSVETARPMIDQGRSMQGRGIPGTSPCAQGPSQGQGALQHFKPKTTSQGSLAGLPLPKLRSSPWPLPPVGPSQVSQDQWEPVAELTTISAAFSYGLRKECSSTNG